VVNPLYTIACSRLDDPLHDPAELEQPGGPDRGDLGVGGQFRVAASTTQIDLNASASTTTANLRAQFLPATRAWSEPERAGSTSILLSLQSNIDAGGAVVGVGDPAEQ